MQNRKHYSALFLSLILGTSISNAYGLDLEIKPSVLLNSTYTDNENQSPTPTSADIIAEASPAVSILANGARTQANLDYSIRKQVSYTRNIDKLNHQLRGAGDFALIKNYVNVFATGNYEQRQNQVGQNILFDETLQLEDTANIGSIAAGADITNHVKRHFDSKLKYTFNTTKSDSTTFADTSSHNIVASLKNGTSFHRLSWGGDANYQELDDANLKLKKIAEVTGHLGYLINRQTGFRASLGYESNPQYTQVNPNIESKGIIATGTAFWRSPKKLSIELMAGKRSYGDTYQAKTDWQSNTTNLTASYGRTITGDNFAVSLSQQIRQAAFRLQYNKTLSEYNYSSLIDDPTFVIITRNESETQPLAPLIMSVQTGTYIVSRLSSGMALKGNKNSIDLGADYETKEYTETGGKSRTYKATAQWKSKITTLANTNLTIEAVDANDASLGAVGLYSSIKFSYEHKIKKYFLTSLSGQRWERRPGDGNNIVVNLVSFSVKASY